MLTLSLSGYTAGAMALCDGMPMPVSQSTHRTAGIDRDEDAVLIASAQRAATECGSMATSVHSSNSIDNCAASATCGIVTAPQVLVFIAPAEGAGFLLPRTPPVFGFLTDAPDRPPRAFA